MKTIKTQGDKIFDIFNVVLMVFVVFLTLFPFWYIIIGSLNDGLDYQRGGVYFFPRILTLKNYQVVLSDRNIWPAFVITAERTLLGTVLHLLITSLFSYAFSRKELVGKRFYSVFGLATLFFSGGLIPFYLVINKLGLINTFWVYILPGLFSFYNVLIFSSFFRELPDSIMESARLDGASEYRIFFRLIVPLSMPVFAALALFTAVYHWNSFFDSMLFTNSVKMQTIMLYLMKMIRNQESSSQLAKQFSTMSTMYRNVTGLSIQMAAVIVVSLPIIMIYPFLQKYFAAGMLIGSIKE